MHVCVSEQNGGQIVEQLVWGPALSLTRCCAIEGKRLAGPWHIYRGIQVVVISRR